MCVKAVRHGCVQRSSTGLVSAVPLNDKAGAEWCRSSEPSFGLSQAPVCRSREPRVECGEYHGQDLCHSNGDPQKPQHLQPVLVPLKGIHFLPMAYKEIIIIFLSCVTEDQNDGKKNHPSVSEPNNLNYKLLR